MEIALYAKSSSREEPYLVTFVYKDGFLAIYCNCPAGQLGKPCKYKLSLLQNDSSMLFDAAQAPQLQKITEIMEKTQYPAILREIHEAEEELEKAQKRLKKLKSKLARHMRDGLK